MAKVVSIDTCSEKLNVSYSPKIIGKGNDPYAMVMKGEGNKCPRHTHKNKDEFTI